MLGNTRFFLPCIDKQFNPMKKFFLGFLLILLVILIGIGWYLNSLHPTRSGELKLPGLTAPVEVLYDEFGIPHIYAENEPDVWRALGYVHAQDRLFQMELLRRVGDGRLAEIFGEDMLPVDRFFRSLGFRQYAKKTIDSVYRTQPNAAFVTNAEAYVAGVNAYIQEGKTPIEFTLGGIPKTPFTLEDAEIIASYMSFTFMEAFRGEAITDFIAQKLGSSYARDLGIDTSTDEPKIPVDALAFAQLAKSIQGWESKLPVPPLLGSNGWVISGKKTKSGKPILSNDTHIAFAQPAVWYEAHLEAPGLRFYGNFVAGVPFAFLGHHQHGGWGLTMFLNDEMDFYREKVNPANPNQVWYKKGWEPLQTRTDTIRIKGGKSEVLTVRQSRHGVLISDVMKTPELVAPFQNESAPIAVYWTYLQFPSRNLEACYGLAKAHDVQAAELAVRKIHSPGLNVMWADTAGNIAWWATGKLIHRPDRVNSKVVLDGSSGLDDPLGWLDFSENPQILNPASGVLYTANNQPEARRGKPYPGYYVPTDRAARIQQLLFTEKSDWTPTEVREVIHDVTNPRFVEMIQKTVPSFEATIQDPKAKEVLTILKKWTGRHERKDIEPAIFYRWMYRVDEFALRDDVGEAYFDILRWNMVLEHGRMGLYENPNSLWWDNRKTPVVETREEILAKAFEQAVKDLESQWGKDPKTWVWEKMHTLTHPHPLAVVPVIGKFFEVGPLPVPGGKSTINNLDFRVDSTGLYPVKYGPALRRIIDFGDWEHATSVNPTGQSGYFRDPHYQDQAKMFAESKARPERMNRKDIETHQPKVLRLKPE